MLKETAKLTVLLTYHLFMPIFQDYNNNNAANDVKNEIERLKAEVMEGLVLDLRK